MKRLPSQEPATTAAPKPFQRITATSKESEGITMYLNLPLNPASLWAVQLLVGITDRHCDTLHAGAQNRLWTKLLNLLACSGTWGMASQWY